METDKHISEIVEEYFRNSEYKIIDFGIRGERGTRVLEILVDSQAGISIDDLAGINRDLRERVDNDLTAKDLSRLIVSSPGAENPIKYIWQLNKHVGRTLLIETKDGESFEGKLLRVIEGSDSILVEIPLKGKDKQNPVIEREINFGKINQLKVKISFSKK